MSSLPYLRVLAQFENGNLSMVLTKLTYSTLDSASISGLLTMDAFYCTENVVS